MATIDSANNTQRWNDGACRKQHVPPRIGDIQRQKTIELESGNTTPTMTNTNVYLNKRSPPSSSSSSSSSTSIVPIVPSIETTTGHVNTQTNHTHPQTKNNHQPSINYEIDNNKKLLLSQSSNINSISFDSSNSDHEYDRLDCDMSRIRLTDDDIINSSAHPFNQSKFINQFIDDTTHQHSQHSHLHNHNTENNNHNQNHNHHNNHISNSSSNSSSVSCGGAIGELQKNISNDNISLDNASSTKTTTTTAGTFDNFLSSPINSIPNINTTTTTSSYFHQQQNQSNNQQNFFCYNQQMPINNTNNTNNNNQYHYHQFSTNTNTTPAITTACNTINCTLATNTKSCTTIPPLCESQLPNHLPLKHYHRPPPLLSSISYNRLLPKTQSLDLCDREYSLMQQQQQHLFLTTSKSSDIATASAAFQQQQQQQQQSSISSSSTMSSFLPKNCAGNGNGNGNCGGTMPIKVQSLDQTRPIYPNVPYSPYGSPYGSPRSGRRRHGPLRESRRISIEQSGSFLQLNQYKLMDQIGQGSYGLVKLAYSEEDSIHYAMKILSKRKLLRKAGLMGRGPKRGTSPLDRVYREIAVLKKLDHPNVVKLIEVLDDPLEDSLYLVFELVQLGEVLSIPTENPLSEERVWSIFRDALQGLEYLHYQRIIHSDIKPGNLLLAECGRVKIADLGVCNEFLGEDASMNNGSTAGTPAFRAPETLLTGQHSYSGKAADIWALGATLYALLFGNVPFMAVSVPAVYEKIKNEELKFPDNDGGDGAAGQISISDDLRDLIGAMLNKDPTKRLTLPQIKEHSWVTCNNTCPLPSEADNCRLVQISEEDINTVVKSIPKLDTLILIKTMLKKHSFQNPFTKNTAVSGRAPQRGGSRLERFTRAGRSNSAPGAYHMAERQSSNENNLPSVIEGVVVNSYSGDSLNN